jgi:DNA-binding MarR family transcriptional regulator
MTKTLKLMSVIAIIGAVAITNVAATALASNGEEDEFQKPMNRPAINQERMQHMEEMKAVVESGNYEAFQALIAEIGRTPPMLENINADNFHLLGELHQAKQDGDFDRVKELAEELGIERPNMGQHKGQFKKRMQNIDPEKREAVRAAVESGDYDAWYALITEDGRTPPILENVNADNFHLLMDLHQAKQDKNMERAKELADELGFKKPDMGKHKGQRFNQPQ